MSPQDILNAILSIATAARNGNIGGPGGPATITDWLNLLLSGSVTDPVRGLLDRFTAKDYAELVEQLKNTRLTLIDDPADPDKILALSEGDQLKLSALNTLIFVLTAKNEVVAQEQSAVAWLSENALPLIQQAVPIVLTMI